jgi:NADH:ubiquinone oxidoreductase subunit K
MNISPILFLSEVLGFVLNRKNIILKLISIEIMLLAINFLILVISASSEGASYLIRKLSLGFVLRLLAIIVLPLLGLIVSGFFGTKIGVSASLFKNVMAKSSQVRLHV